MSQPDVRDVPVRGPARVAPYAVVGVLLVVAIVAPLIVSIYARSEPSIGGFPFFYWYQLLWVLIDSVLLAIAYRVLRKEDRRRRDVARAAAASSAPTKGEDR
jgi:uncharacterized BrkB/YihY/UPF0761 family membrane protein